MIWIVWLFGVSLLILVLNYPLYQILLTFIGRKTKHHSSPHSTLPFVSVLIPAFNEIQIIENKIKNSLELDYPDDLIEIIFIDDASHDGTKEILSDYAQRYEKIKVITQKDRKGKPAALNKGLKVANGDIIVVSDADCLPQANCVKLLVERLNDPRCGLVGAYTEIVGKKGIVYDYEQFYWTSQNHIRTLEAKVDSPFSVIAACYAFKKALISSFEESVLADDMWACMKVREKGYFVDYLSEAKVLDYGEAKSIGKLISQKIRKGFACWQVFVRFRHMLLNLNYGLFGMLILPSTFLKYLVCPYAFIIFIGAGIFLLTNLEFMIFEAILLSPIFLWVIFSWFNIVGNKRRFQFSIIRLLLPFSMFALYQIILILAQFYYITGVYDTRWSKIR